MKATINEEGYLFIERAEVLKRQYCPFRKIILCGDWCPLFGEPIQGDSCIEIDLCQRRFLVKIEEFKDKRIKNNE